MAPAAIAGQPGPERQRERQHGDRLEREEGDRDQRLRRHVPADEADDGDREQARQRGVAGDHDRQPEPAPDDELARRSGRASIAWTVPDLDVRRDRRRGEERGRHREHEAEHERDQDQDLADADPDLELRRRRSSRRVATRAARPPSRRARRSPPTRPSEHPDDAAARRSRAASAPAITRTAEGHRVRLAVLADQPEEQVLERAPAGVDGVDPPAEPDDRGDERRGSRSASIGRIVEPARRRGSTGPNGRQGSRTASVAAGRSTRIRTAVSPSSSVERAGRDDPAAVDDRDPVAQPLDLAEEVRVEEHGRARGRGPRG